METKRYYHGHLDRIDDGPSPLPDVNEAEMLVFLATTIQMGHSIRDKLTDYGATTNQFHTGIYSSAMKWDRYLHILHFLHFTDNNEPEMMDKNSYRLRKMRKSV